jgi:methyl-accepting chemotaxis protein
MASVIRRLRGSQRSAHRGTKEDMSSEQINPAKEFQKHFQASSLVLSITTVAFVSVYLSALLNLSAEQWWHFGYLVAGLFPVMFVAVQLLNRRLTRPIFEFWDAKAFGTIEDSTAESAFAAASSLPVRIFRSGLSWWTAGGAFVAIGMKLRFPEISGYIFLVICLAALSGGTIASIFHYFMNRAACVNVLEQVSAVMSDSIDREKYATRINLREKLLVSVTSVSLVTVVFAMFLSLVNSAEPLERNAADLQFAYLTDVRSSLDYAFEHADVDLDEIVDRARRLTIANDVLMLDIATGEPLAGQPAHLSPVELGVIRSGQEGTSTEIDSPSVFAWLEVPELGVKLVATTPWSVVRGDSSGLMWLFAGVVFMSGMISFLLAHFLAGDFGVRTVELKEAALRMASGDLRKSVQMVAEDELGDLASAFADMGVALRSAVGGVATGADEVDNAAGEIAAIAELVAHSADEQSAGVKEALQATERMNAEVGGIASSSQELNMLVEESSSSILEMGAAGEELNDTAGVLSSRIEEVSSSIEQMVRSVKEVNDHTSSLSDAAADTSSSMEEMASAMRQVDTIAVEASKLSLNVVVAAEGGRDAVRQTIVGMESIRDATAQAEQVIVGLGTRTNEIGSILDVIDDVADETNLLALNAAIIAAQAGEQGKAFSVVADEIKELADRVLASTKEIGDLIRAVQQESENAVGAIAEGTRSVAQGVERSREAGEALEVITSTSRTSGDHIAEILRSVQEQSKAATHVVEMMERVNGGVEAIHRATNEQDRANDVVSRSTVAMREVSIQLRSTTEEQSRGGMRIRESIDGVRDAVESINSALQAQSSSCQDVVGFLEEVSASSQANDVSSARLGSATKVLIDQGKDLRAGVQKFVIDA